MAIMIRMPIIVFSMNLRRLLLLNIYLLNSDVGSFAFSPCL